MNSVPAAVADQRFHRRGSDAGHGQQHAGLNRGGMLEFLENPIDTAHMMQQRGFVSVRTMPLASSAECSPVLCPTTACGRDAEMREQRVDGLIAAKNSFRADVHGEQPCFRRHAGRRKDAVAEAISAIGERLVHEIEPLPNLGEVNAEVRKHSGVLRAFAGEHQRETTLASERFAAKIDAFDFADAARAAVLNSRADARVSFSISS
jgi:hypothetical protein